MYEDSYTSRNSELEIKYCRDLSCFLTWMWNNSVIWRYDKVFENKGNLNIFGTTVTIEIRSIGNLRAV
jgi:hypothetical protein